MLKLAVLGLAALGAAGLSDALNTETIQAVNTFLNFLSVTLLLRASRKYREEVTPAMKQVETVVDEVLQPRTDGRRHYDS